jgi:hypothetical protein
LRYEEGIGEEHEELIGPIEVDLEIGGERPYGAVVFAVRDHVRPRRRRCYLSHVFGSRNDRRRDIAEEPLVPLVNGDAARLYEKLILSAEARRLSRREDDRAPHGRDS